MKKYSAFLLFSFFSLGLSAQVSIPVNFTHDGQNMYGRLQLPAGNPPFRTIVVLPGSGANDMDGTIPMHGSNTQCLYPALSGDTLRPYKGLSDVLAAAGYAVFTYDKLEYTYPMPPAPLSLHRLWMTGRSILDWIMTRTDIDTSHVVLIGHSEGSSLAPVIATAYPSVKAIISLAGPRTPLDTMIARQLIDIAQTCGGNVALATQQGAQIMQYGAQVRSGNYNSGTPPLFGVSAAVWEDYFHMVDSVSLYYNQAARPTLFIGLGDDFNVPVSTELNRFQQEITIPADFYNLAGLNHYLTTATNPAISSTLTDTIIHWLKGVMPPLSLPGTTDALLHELAWELQGRALHLSTSEKPVKSVKIYDTTGKLVLRKSCYTTTCILDLNHLTPAVYLVEVRTGKDRQTIKIGIR